MKDKTKNAGKVMGKAAKLTAMVKAPKMSYLLRHPVKGPKNLLALRGIKSLLKTRSAAIAAAAVATTAIATPIAMKILRRDSES